MSAQSEHNYPPGKKLNLGCGTNIRPSSEGWVNLDIVSLPGVDVVHDLCKFPYPFPENEFVYILVSHVVEHLPHRAYDYTQDIFVLMMEELHRILRSGGILEIRVPHYRSDVVWCDPTHCRIVHPSNFIYFTDETDCHYTKKLFKIINKQTIYRFSLGHINEWHIKRYSQQILSRLQIKLPNEWLSRISSLIRCMAISPREFVIWLKKI